MLQLQNAIGSFWGTVGVAVLFVLFEHFRRRQPETFPEVDDIDGLAVDAAAVVQVDESAQAHSQIEHIDDYEIPELMEKMPYNCWSRNTFQRENNLWRFQFECNHVGGRFHATTFGHTPREAFALCRHMILQQLSDWHRVRFDEPEAPALDAVVAHKPKVLIVDDDVELALATQQAFHQMGYQTEVATRYEDLHRKIVASDADYIFLDWKLNDEVTAGQVVEKAVRLIDTFKDLRDKFSQQRPRLVTYSVLERDQINLPVTGDRYFTHLDHWQKPMPFHEVMERVSELPTLH